MKRNYTLLGKYTIDALCNVIIDLPDDITDDDDDEIASLFEIAGLPWLPHSMPTELDEYEPEFNFDCVEECLDWDDDTPASIVIRRDEQGELQIVEN